MPVDINTEFKMKMYEAHRALQEIIRWGEWWKLKVPDDIIAEFEKDIEAMKQL